MTVINEGRRTTSTASGAAADADGIWLTPGEYAEILQVEADTVEHWRKTGIGPAPVGRGRRRRYDLASVQSYLLQQHAEGAEKLA